LAASSRRLSLDAPASVLTGEAPRATVTPRFRASARDVDFIRDFDGLIQDDLCIGRTMTRIARGRRGGYHSPVRQRRERACHAGADHGSAYDVTVIGAGISGMYQLHRLRGLGLCVRVFEAGDGVGGTWYLESLPRSPVRLPSRGPMATRSRTRSCASGSGASTSRPSRRRLRYCNFVADKLDPAPRHRVRLSNQGRGLRRGRRRVGDRERGRPARASPVPDHRDRAPVGAHHAHDPWRRGLPRRGVPHGPVAARARQLRGQACRGDRHRRGPQCRRSPRSRRRSATSRCSSAPRTGARRFTTARSTRPPGSHQGHVSGDFCALPRVRSAASSTTPIRARPRGDPRGARGLSSRSSNREPGFGIWMGNFRDVLINEEANATITEFMRGRSGSA